MSVLGSEGFNVCQLARLVPQGIGRLRTADDRSGARDVCCLRSSGSDSGEL